MKSLFSCNYNETVATPYDALVARISSGCLSSSADGYDISHGQEADRYNVQLTPDKRVGLFFNSFQPAAQVALQKSGAQTRVSMHVGLVKGVKNVVAVFAVLLLLVFALLLVEVLLGQPIPLPILAIPMGMLLFLLALTAVAFRVEARRLWKRCLACV